MLNGAGKCEFLSTIGSEYTHLVGEQKNSDFDGFITDEFGISLGLSCFFNEKPLGIHLRTIFQVPIKGEMDFHDIDGYVFSSGTEKAETVILGRSVIGPVYKLRLSPKATFFWSIGLGLRAYEIIYRGDENKYNIYILHTSLSSDLGYNYNFHKSSFLQFGVNFDYNSTPLIGTDLIISPFIGLGVKY